MKKIFLFLTSFVFLTACASVPPITPEDVISINAKEKSAIMLTATAPGQCYNSSIGVLNNDNSTVYYLNMGNKRVGYRSVPPGNYEIYSGSCSGYNMTGNYPLLRLWFKSVEVKPGEVVNLGHLKTELLSMKSKPGSEVGQLFNFLITLDSNNLSEYITYDIQDANQDAVKKLLAKDFPDINTEFSTKIPQRFITEDEFRQAVLDAYAEDENGKRPETKVAEAKLRENLKSLLEEKFTAGEAR